MNIIRKEILRLKDSKTDKVYEVEVVEGKNEHFVNFRYGKAGGKLREGTKTKSRVSKKKAHSIFDALVKEKLKKGYKVWDGEEPSEVESIVAVLKETNEVSKNTVVSSALKDLEGGVNDIVCTVLKDLLPEKSVIYPNFDGGWVEGTVAEEYKELVDSVVVKSGLDLAISSLKVDVNDENIPEDEQEIKISFQYRDNDYEWSFMMDDQNTYFNGISKWISDISNGSFLYISDDVGLYGFFLSEKAIEKLKELGVSPLSISLGSNKDNIDLVGKHISFAVLNDHEDITEEWVEILEIYGAFPQKVINTKTDYVVFGDLDQKPLAKLNNNEVFEQAKMEGKALLSFWTLQELVGQLDY